MYIGQKNLSPQLSRDDEESGIEMFTGELRNVTKAGCRVFGDISAAHGSANVLVVLTEIKARNGGNLMRPESGR